MSDDFPVPRLAELPPEIRASLAEAASEAVWIPRPHPGKGVRLTRVEGWRLSESRWGLLMICGYTVRPDGSTCGVAVVPLLIEDRFAWTSVGWLELGTARAEADPERLTALLDRAETWCADLRRALLS